MARPATDWMTPDQVAEEFQMARKTLANQRSRGDGFPFIRLPGGRIRYSRAAIAKYLAEHNAA